LDSFVYTKVPNTIKKLMRQRVRWNFGSLWNLKKYSFMFSLEYGDLGIFVLPVTLIFMGLSVFLLFYYFAMLLWNTAYSFNLLSLTGYAVKYHFFNILLSRIINFILDVKFFFTVILFLVSAIVYVLANKNIKEKLQLGYLAYLLVYGWVLIVFQFIALIYFCIGKKPRW